MARTKLRLEPHSIRGREDAWWYEEGHGITVVVEPQQRTTQIKIPWASLQSAFNRKAEEQADGN